MEKLELLPKKEDREYIIRCMDNLRKVIPIPEHLKTMYVENRFSGRSAELEHDAYRLHECIIPLGDKIMEHNEILMLNPKSKTILTQLQDMEYAFNAMRSYFRIRWPKEYMILID